MRREGKKEKDKAKNREERRLRVQRDEERCGRGDRGFIEKREGGMFR